MNNMNNFGKIKVEGAHITSRNFGGDKDHSKYAQPGKRFFSLVIEDPEMAEFLLEQGVNLGYKEPVKEGDNPRWFLKIKINYSNGYGPRIYIYENDKETVVTEENISVLDKVDIINVDLVFRLYKPTNKDRQWTNSRGGVGCAAYLDIMYVTIDFDPFADKYRGSFVSSDADYSELDE